jgi:hypothetical protein
MSTEAERLHYLFSGTKACHGSRYRSVLQFHESQVKAIDR